ncbi:MAG: hypothetical protein CVU56_26135 [Deltaproteobacteria bacterium HGW-Deltaproteobacteria-14]|jgi:hypothetical protein|nr:MAG: hypothetical protein CVU56_26135 [Deltaproteobacteria bacterium HGW-Deltaproteobacteria-14]
MAASGCGDGGGGAELRVLATALVSAPASGDAGTVRIIGATDWQGTGREPLDLVILLDGEPAGWVIGEEALPASEGSGVSFGVPSGTIDISVAKADGEVVWDFGPIEVSSGRTTDLVYFGSPSDPRVMQLDDPGADLPAGQAAARLINLDDGHGPVNALLCPENRDDLDGCEVVAEGIGYGESWTGAVAVADRLVLLWERPAPQDFPWGRFAGGGAAVIGHPQCHVSEPLVRTLTLIPVHAFTPEEAPECPYCTSGWSAGDGMTPGDCAW